MAAKTFGELWNEVLLFAPGTPAPIAQRLVRNTYRRIIDMHYWSELRKDARLEVGADYDTGTVALTNGSTTATITGGAWTGLENRTVRFNGEADTYTILTVSGASDEIATLDRAYTGPADTDATHLVADFYIEFPTDLVALDEIRDQDSSWRLRRQFHQQAYLDLIDPTRTSTGTPCLYVAAPPRISAGVLYPRYEFWPRPAEGSTLLYRYYASSELTTNSSRIITMLAPDAVLYGALALLALWPGTAERPNPYFSVEAHREHTKLFEEAVHDSEMSDLDVAQNLITYDDANVGLPADANWLQSHGIPY